MILSRSTSLLHLTSKNIEKKNYELLSQVKYTMNRNIATLLYLHTYIKY